MTLPAPRAVRFDGQQTTYLEAGDPAAPPVVLLHDGAFGSDARSCWSTLMPLLAQGHRVVAPDLLGHGGSPKVYDYALDPMSQRIAHIAAFLEVMALDEVVVVGSSFGGGMALQAAVRRSWPMSAAVSICGPGGIFMIPEEFAKLQSYEPSLEAAEGIESLLTVEVTDESVKRRYEATLEPGHWEALAAARVRNPALNSEAPDWRPVFRDALTRVDLPVLVIGGSDDQLLEKGWAEQMAELIPSASSLTVANARHQPHIDHPDEVAGAIESFLAEHELT